jgi:hypothetical protein
LPHFDFYRILFWDEGYPPSHILFVNAVPCARISTCTER